MENYMEYHVMGSVSQVRMKPACMPSKFQCQPDRRKRTFNATKRPYILKKQRLTLIKECEKDLEERSVTTKQVEVGESSSGISGYGGRITDTCLVEQCDFIRCLQPGMYVMADRGFKHVEQYLRKRECRSFPPIINAISVPSLVLHRLNSNAREAVILPYLNSCHKASATADGLAPEGPRKQKGFAYKLLKRGLANLMSPTSTSGVAPPLCLANDV
ncbi:hypothetical protein EVAR_42743_1 [Eumeta japonica]|uniref:DDE Tnp4 domain-containing protein n=1 Tax=Eumeta variegata TaxID=151549 RepID=A0A4C1XHQ0_EUMVA|nr:hypothetical protein EVAR_42743_1 [Eumeta japonica]